MTDLPDPGTDPIPEGGDEPYGFWATLFGLPLHERRLLKRIEQLITTPADTAALEDSLVKLRAADTTVDAIEPPPPFNHTERTHTGHRDGNPGASSKTKGTNP